jgi:hypothetical protein
MYEVDVIFTNNIHDLARGDTAISLFGDIAQLGLTTAAAAIPVSQTTKVLSATATAVGATNAVLDKDVLLAQSLQLIEIQMKTDRSSIKQTILSRMGCNVTQYPIGLALSDLQAYADAGTLASALASMSKSVSNTQPVPSTTKGTAAASTYTTTGTAASSSPLTPSPCPIS